jgi:two-component system nitrate/nitrite response regulator NarL
MALQALIVDDNGDFLQAARTLLERDGITVRGVAETSAEGVRLARELNPDVILVDINLGGESGFDLTRQLERDAELGSRVILISTHAEQDFADLIAQSPAHGFLAKSRLSGRAVREMVGRGRPDADGRPWLSGPRGTG